MSGAPLIALMGVICVARSSLASISFSRLAAELEIYSISLAVASGMFFIGLLDDG